MIMQACAQCLYNNYDCSELFVVEMLCCYVRRVQIKCTINSGFTSHKIERNSQGAFCEKMCEKTRSTSFLELQRKTSAD